MRVARAVQTRAWSGEGTLRRAPRALLLAALPALLALPGRVRAQDPPLFIAPVTLIDGTGSRPRADMAVLVRDGRVAAVGLAAAMEPPAGALHVDGTGRFLIPGLWDLHVHLSKAGESALDLLLAHGVTGVRDLGGDTEVVLGLRCAVEAGRPGPRIVLAGPIVESPDRIERMRRRGVVEPVERYRAPLEGPGHAAALVDSIAALGADLVKFRTVPSLEAYRALAAAAADRGLPLAGHVDGIAPREVIAAGQASIEHPLYPTLPRLRRGSRRSLLGELAESGVAIVPTLVTYHHSAARSRGDLAALVGDSAGVLDPRRRYVGGFLLEHWRFQLSERPGGVGGWLRGRLIDYVYGGMHRDLRDLHRAGVRILPGTDVAVIGIVPGFSLHDELQLLVERVGMTPLEVLLAATRHAAELAGLGGEVGTVEAGKAADLVLLDADPLAEIRNTRRVMAVVRGGRLFDRAALDALLRDAEASAP